MDLVVDYAVLFVMNVCEEKRKRRLRARTRRLILCLPCTAGLRMRKACRAVRECQASCRQRYINFCCACSHNLFLLHALAHAHSSDRLACFKAPMMPRSSEDRQLAQGKLCLFASTIVKCDDFDSNNNYIITTILCLRPGSQT